SVASPAFEALTLALDLGVLAACGLDYALAPPSGAVRVQRRVEPVLSAGVPNVVHLEIEALRPLRGELRDAAPAGTLAEGHRQRFVAQGRPPAARLAYRLTPPARGDLDFGDLHL